MHKFYEALTKKLIKALLSIKNIISTRLLKVLANKLKFC